MGEVFRAVAVGESGFEKPVVVKRILPAHLGRSDLAELFIAEAKLMTRLAHPNIVEVLDFGRGESRDYFLVLELVDGVDLARLHRGYSARGERMPIPLALFVVAQVLRGLHHAHAKSGGEGGWLVHRDVSPGNVLLSTAGEVKVADFGVALIARSSGGERGPSAKGIVGKPQYMAPEQYDGDDVDARADLFSVGVMLFFLLTDAFPFEGATLAEQQDAAHRGDFGRTRDHRAEISAEIDALVRRALAPRPADRFADAKAMATAIEALQARGQPLAGGDDVAVAVEAAMRAQPAPGRRVIALSGSARADDDEPALTERELTRTGAAGALGSFTLRVAEGEPTPPSDAVNAERGVIPSFLVAAPDPAPIVDPAPPALPMEQPSETPVIPLDPAPLPVRGVALLAGALLLVIAAGLGARALFTGPATPAPSGSADAPSPDPSSRLPVEAPPIPPVSLSSTSSTSSTSSPEPSTHAVAPPRSLAPRASAASSAAPIAVAPPAIAATADDCTGVVHFTSIGSWNVDGGPRPAQTPNLVTWRCGTYALSAVSRVDPAQRKRITVTVRAGATALVDLR